jgi:hypothetical protein
MLVYIPRGNGFLATFAVSLLVADDVLVVVLIIVLMIIGMQSSPAGDVGLVRVHCVYIYYT